MELLAQYASQVFPKTVTSFYLSSCYNEKYIGVNPDENASVGHQDTDVKQ
jgi:hypothetical protein